MRENLREYSRKQSLVGVTAMQGRDIQARECGSENRNTEILPQRDYVRAAIG
jgi:hypothetical protein